MTPKLARHPLTSSGYKVHQKDLALTFYIQSLLSKITMERVTSHRPKHTQLLSTTTKVQNRNTRVHQGLSDSRGMGVFNRFLRCLPSYPHPPNIRFTHRSQIYQFNSLPFNPATAHTHLYNGSKRSEAHGPHQRGQTSPIPV